MPIEELAMLECLLRIDGGLPMDKLRTEFPARLIVSGLAERQGDELELTVAGIERCQALQHRLKSDVEAARLREESASTLPPEDSPP